jgi:hypothetical protein
LAEELANVRPRPFLIAVSDWRREQLPYGEVFDAYCLKPCLPGAMVTAVQEALLPRP